MYVIFNIATRSHRDASILYWSRVQIWWILTLKFVTAKCKPSSHELTFLLLHIKCIRMKGSWSKSVTYSNIADCKALVFLEFSGFLSNVFWLYKYAAQQTLCACECKNTNHFPVTTWSPFHKTSSPNKPDLFQLVWFLVNWFGSK